jgi:hypothetical protein
MKSYRSVSCVMCCKSIDVSEIETVSIMRIWYQNPDGNFKEFSPSCPQGTSYLFCLHLVKLDSSETWVQELRYQNTTGMSDSADKLAACVGTAPRRFTVRICLRIEFFTLSLTIKSFLKYQICILVGNRCQNTLLLQTSIRTCDLVHNVPPTMAEKCYLQAAAPLVQSSCV